MYRIEIDRSLSAAAGCPMAAITVYEEAAA
jgi:ferredoxin